jgi:hypothetical protein
LLLDQRHVLAGVEAGLRHRREQLELVAEAPVTDLLAAQVGRRPDVLLGEADLVGAGALVDLPDVGDLGALLPGGQRLGHPGDREVGLALGQHRLRHDVDAALQDLHVEALLGVEPLVHGRDVAGELGLHEPLQLQLDAGDAAAARRGLRLVGAAAGRGGEQEGAGHDGHQRAPRGTPGLGTGRVTHRYSRGRCGTRQLDSRFRHGIARRSSSSAVR